MQINISFFFSAIANPNCNFLQQMLLSQNPLLLSRCQKTLNVWRWGVFALTKENFFLLSCYSHRSNLGGGWVWTP